MPTYLIRISKRKPTYAGFYFTEYFTKFLVKEDDVVAAAQHAEQYCRKREKTIAKNHTLFVENIEEFNIPIRERTP